MAGRITTRAANGGGALLVNEGGGILVGAGLSAAVFVALAVLLTACGGGSPSTSPSSQTSSKKSTLAFSQCMRAHGVSNFPDPNSQGTYNSSAFNGIDRSSPQFQSALQSCEKDLPQRSSGRSTQDQQQLLKFSQCMRSHGVSNFPDLGGGSRPSGGYGIDTQSPQFRSALQACEPLLSSLRGGGG